MCSYLTWQQMKKNNVEFELMRDFVMFVFVLVLCICSVFISFCLCLCCGFVFDCFAIAIFFLKVFPVRWLTLLVSSGYDSEYFSISARDHP